MSKPSSDNRPEYDGYTRPSALGCVTGVIIALGLIGLSYVIVGALLPGVNPLVGPGLAILIFLVGAGMYFYWKSRKTPDADPAEQAAKREQFDQWMDEELESQHGKD
ncbi:MAG: hypothetical protein U9R25_07375 [Chloroflexota bacterium]|nr:hypothetical protein [Chloroflexota bacterium]